MTAFGHFLAQHLTHGEILLVSGDLGAGKSTLARGVITAILTWNGFAVDDIPSPSFTLVQSYPFPHEHDEEGEIWHIDLWRLEDRDEIIELGFDEAIGRHAMVIEWPERLGRDWAKIGTMAMTITMDDPDSRMVELTLPEDSRWHRILDQFSHDG